LYLKILKPDFYKKYINMKILVCVTPTPETTAKIAFKDNNTAYDTNGVNYIMNPYDEWYALVRGIELKEQFEGSKVTIINVGPASNDSILRKGLAIGADQALRVDAEPQSAYFVAAQIAKYAKGFDIILLGKETIDYNGGEVGGMLAELLDLPFISYATDITMEGTVATISRDIEGGNEILQVQTPFVASAAKGLAEQRIPNMRGIMMAKKKPLVARPAADMKSPVAVSGFTLPDAKGAVTLVDPENMDELVRLLHEEAKAI
jgi:electron transfer flavoprotein beta subunit